MIRSSLVVIVLLGGIALSNAKHLSQEGKVKRQSPKIHPHMDVLILGAGLSGIVAGKTLKDNGIDDFLILEGQDYIGGRIKQVDIAGYKVEEGANFIHYRDDKYTKETLLERQQKTKIEGRDSNTENIIHRDASTGEVVFDSKSVERLNKAISNIGKEQMKLLYQQGRYSVSADVGLKLVNWEANTPFEMSLEWFSYDFAHAREPSKISFFTLGSSTEAGTPDYFITDKRGVLGLYTDFYEGFKSKIKLEKEVTEIKKTPAGVKVVTANNEIYTANYVLCTFSTGVLASDMVKFSPPLSVPKKVAIANMPLGTFTKIFVKFEKKFWDDKLFIALPNAKRGYYPIIKNLDFPKAFPGSGLILMIVTGDEGKKVENQPKETTKKQIAKLLRDIYKEKATEPTDIFYGRWTKNRFVRGAYSDIKVGSFGEDSERELQKPELNNTLYFSGEATSNKWHGYMQGAFSTGKIQATKIVKKLKDQKQKDSIKAMDEVVSAWSRFMI